MAGIALQIDDLLLDVRNPRISRAEGQREALQKILDDQDHKLVVLAESIASDGLNPMDRLLVIKSEDQPGKYVVVEGNRRTAAIKLLTNPAVLPSLDIRPALHTRLSGLAKDWDRSRVEPIDCFEVADRIAANSWIQQRHTGENQGRGIVSWNGVASRRFIGQDPALQALDFVVTYGGLTEDEKERTQERFPITTLDRLISTPDVRKLIGLEIEADKLTTKLPADEAMRSLKRIVMDLASGALNVTKVKSKKQQVDWVGALGSDLPDLTKASSSSRSLEAIDNKDFASKAGPTTKPKLVRGSAVRKSLPMKGRRLNVTNAKVSEIYKELIGLRLSDNPHAISVLMRVFLETSVDQYLTTAGISLRASGGARERDKALATKLTETVEHMAAAGAPKKDFDGVVRGMSDKSHPLSVDLLHAYVHNRFVTPTERDLTAAWDNAQPLFERIWP